MKKIFPFIVLLFSLSAFAQDKFIEVEVRDTVSLVPESFEYIINIYYAPDLMIDEGENSYDIKAEKKAFTKKADEIKKLLQKRKYNFRPIQDDSYEIDGSSFYRNSGYIVKFKTAQELLQLKALLDKIDNIYGTIDNVHYRDEARLEERLLKKLIERAMSKASVLASASGLKLGKILEVKEEKELGEFDINIHDTYFVNEKNKNLIMQDGYLTGSFSKALVVKFAAE